MVLSGGQGPDGWCAQLAVFLYKWSLSIVCCHHREANRSQTLTRLTILECAKAKIEGPDGLCEKGLLAVSSG